MAYKKLSIKEFKEAFGLFFKFTKYSRKYRKAQFILFVLESISIFFALLSPYLGKIILDNGILDKNLALFFKVTFIGVAAYVFKISVDRSANFLKKYLIRKVKIDLAKDIFKNVARLSLQFFQGTSAGECVSRMNTDIISSSGSIATTVNDILKSVFRIIFVTIIILLINSKILILIFIYQLAVIAQINFFIKKNEALAKAAYEKTREMAKIITQFFSQIYFVKASGSAFLMIKKYFHAFSENARIEVATSRLESISGVASEVSNKLFFGLVGLAGTLLVIRGQLTLGGLAAIMAYLSQGTAAYAELLSLCQKIVLNRLPLERTAELLNAEIHIREKAGAPQIKLSGGKIEFQDVCFGYENNRYILDKINFCIAAHAKVGLVGLSGCGKTTIVNLILRLYDVNQGRILLEGCDLRDMRQKSIYSQIGLAPQLPFIWNGTIRSNIEYGGLKLEDSALISAAELAEIHSVVEALPNGYDTLLLDMVCPLSQGQKQRIAIARAIAKQPKILILDEACSSLDSKTEKRIINNIKTAFPQITLIIVSHRLCAVKEMEKIYFVETPKKVNVGTHQELLESNFAYNELFASQISSAEYNKREIKIGRSER